MVGFAIPGWAIVLVLLAVVAIVVWSRRGRK